MGILLSLNPIYLSKYLLHGIKWGSHVEKQRLNVILVFGSAYPIV